ncbi:MAG: BatA domain-containing protein [Gammaproteobacteria bacterium]|nr:BatA domain-containing protein [Gammaproteobacteria bacterium]
MGFLNPLFLAAAAVVAVPLILHLFHRHELRRVPFPALRYLLRATRDHARTIRIRQLLLLLLRVAICLLLVLAGSRLFWRGAGGTHQPTALVIILDNSLSSGLVQGEQRVLDRLKALALETLDEAGPEDRIWVMRAGEPWDVAVPGSPVQARARVLETQVSGGRADLAAAIERAGALVSAAPLDEAEIQVLSDLQATAFPGDAPVALPADTRLLVYHAPSSPEDNRYLREVLVGGGLAPMTNERSQVSIAVGGRGEGQDTLAVRLVVGGRTVGATTITAGSEALLNVGPFAGGVVSGYAEIDPDALRGDDRRFFSVSVRPPVGVSLRGDGGFFLEQAIEVLARAGRAQRTADAAAQVLLSVGGEGLDGRPAGSAAVVVPPSDGAMLPALNRQLLLAEIPWRYESEPGAGEIGVADNRLPVALDEVRIVRRYRLVANGEEAAGVVQATLDSGEPWIVTGSAPGGSYLLLGSPVDAEATSLAVSAPMLPLVEWMVSRWPFQSDGRSFTVGDALPIPAGVDAVADAAGGRAPAGAGAQVVARAPGLYRLLAGDSLVREVAVNPPAAESILEPIAESALDGVLGDDYDRADASSWRRLVFASRQGTEVWRWLLVAALVLLLLESRVAATGRRTNSSGVGATSGSRGPSVPGPLPRAG